MVYYNTQKTITRKLCGMSLGKLRYVFANLMLVQQDALLFSVEELNTWNFSISLFGLLILENTLMIKKEGFL